MANLSVDARKEKEVEIFQEDFPFIASGRKDKWRDKELGEGGKK